MWADNETSEDLLGFKVHADLLIDVIKDDTMLPTTIGLFGDWGSGKSSILQMIKEELEGKDGELKDNTLVLYFNGWVLEGYDDAKAALLEAIIEKCKEHKDLFPSIKDNFIKFSKTINWMRVLGIGLKGAATAGMAYATGGTSLIPYLLDKVTNFKANDLIGIGESASKLKEDASKSDEELKKQEQKEEDELKLVRKFREEFEEMLKKSDIKRLVVIIDDLDRCTPERIIDNLEAIKLFLNVPKTAFIIGADPRIVRHAIEFRYKTTNKIDDNNSNNRIIDDYLEKLIQIPYSLPKLSEPEVETYISLLISKRELDKSNFQKVINLFGEYRKKNRYSAFGIANFKDLPQDVIIKVKESIITIPILVPLITHSLYGNPRQIKRFLNTYTLRKRLAAVASLVEFNDGILAKLMILEYAEPKLFKQLFEWQAIQNGIAPELETMEKKCDNVDNEEALKYLQNSYKEWAKEKIIKWLGITPKLSGIDLRDYFWISREKVSASITGSSLIPPIVKQLFNKLEKEIPEKVSKEIINEAKTSFSENEFEIFLDYLSQNLKQKSKSKRLYDVFHYLIEFKILNAETHYMDCLKAINPNDIDPSIGMALNNFKNYPILGEFLANYFKDGKTKAAKAFNINSTI